MIFSQTSVYLQQVQSKNQNQISLSTYAHKKILVAICSAFTPDLSRLRILDNLNKSSPSSLQVVIIPLLDIDSPLNKTSLQSSILDTMQFSFIVCKAGYGKKVNSNMQIPFLGWLTNKSGNIHFDNDLQNPWQMFVIGENGILYAELFGASDLMNGNLTGVLNSKVPDN
jgi:glutathione peroxidase-family protein